MPRTSGFDAILFDFDGVLADTEPVHYACWLEVLEPRGFSFTWDFYQANCIGISDRVMLERMGAEQNPPIPFEVLQPEYALKQALLRERLELEPPIYPETLAAVRDLSRRYQLAVVSSSGRSEVEPAIERAGIRSCFQALVCGKEVPNLKPAPDPYLRAAELLGAIRPLVVEDSDAGVASGLAAGFEVLRVSSAEAVARELQGLLVSRS